jgi:hypothetical protein
MNNVRFIKQILYQLKKDYPVKVDFYSIDSEIVDPKTGHKTITKSKVSVRRAIAFPVKTTITFNKEHAYVISNRNFSYGTYLDTDAKRIVIDKIRFT